MLSTLLLSFEAFADSLSGRIIGYGCLLFVAVPCWVGLTLDWVKLW